MLALADGRVGGFTIEGHGRAHVARGDDGNDFATRSDREGLVRRSSRRTGRSQPVGHCIVEVGVAAVVSMVVSKVMMVVIIDGMSWTYLPERYPFTGGQD